MTIGDRVEIPAHLDAWMRGDRYGVVVDMSHHSAGVRLDKSGKRVRVDLDDLRVVS